MINEESEIENQARAEILNSEHREKDITHDEYGDTVCADCGSHDGMACECQNDEAWQ